MKALSLLTVLAIAVGSPAWPGTVSFDDAKPGGLPDGWQAGVTGKGQPKWTVEADESAPSKPHVLKQSSKGTYPWCVLNDASLGDGFVEVKFRPISGRED